MTDTPFKKDHSTLVGNRLQDYDGQWPDCDVSEGSAIFVQSTTDATAEWGLFKEQDRIAKQPFIDQCDDASLDHHGSILGLPRLTAEQKETYRQRLLARKRNPESGGNDADWDSWIRAVEYAHATYTETVKGYFDFNDARGAGSINIVITSDRSEANGGEEEATDELVLAIYAAIAAAKPKGIWDFLVMAAIKKTENIVIEVDGDCDADKTATDIEAFMKSLDPGKKLYRKQLESIAITNGAENPSVTTPATDIEATSGPWAYERLWPGTITVTPV